MSEISKYEAQKKKLEGLCEEHDLTYRVRKEAYPITLTIRPIQGVGEQMSLLEKTDGEDYISPDAVMKWIFADGELTSRVEGGTFTISKTLRSKIENIFLKMIGFWQQYFFRDIIERGSLRKGAMPVIDEGEAEDIEPEPSDAPEDEMDDDFVSYDDYLVKEATALVRAENKATASMLQRRFNIGYAKAARLMDELERIVVIDAYNGSGPREVLPYDVPEDEKGGELNV